MNRCLLMMFIITAITHQSIIAQQFITGKIVDTEKHEPASFAIVRLTSDHSVGAMADVNGVFRLNIGSIHQGDSIEIQLLGYQYCRKPLQMNGTYAIMPSVYQLREVVVTAEESHGIVNTSRIGEDAIKHIQPSSFADLLELIPGGRAEDPSFGKSQNISLRAAASMSSDNYTTESLGTKFVVDGIPMNTDADMQVSPVSSNYGAERANAGVDMRTIATEEIEQVEVVRGIPSVEHGDLTSGMITIKRHQGGHDIKCRFKSDMQSKLLYVGKGFEWNEHDKLTMNVGATWLNAADDPRNTRQNYKRLTGSYRIGKETSKERIISKLNINFDYTGSFDNYKSDRDLDYGSKGPVETYKSTYNKICASAEYTMQPTSAPMLKKLTMSASVQSEFDKIKRWKHVALSSEIPLSTSLDYGEHDATTVPVQYDAALEVDGKPFYAFAKIVSVWGISRQRSDYTLKGGAEWNMDKNFGHGIVFDPELPFSYDMNVRPRDFSTIPANHQLALFAENTSVMRIAEQLKVEWMAGVRATSMLNVGSRYALHGKTHNDTRANVRIEVPNLMIAGQPLKTGISTGIGMHTKLPTMNQLYPNQIYYDVVQLNYWPKESELRRINIYIEKIDPTNYQLKAARNLKWELRADALWNGYSVAVTYFRENMKSGFRNNSSNYSRIIYKDYNEQSIDKQQLTEQPNLSEVPYNLDTMLVSYTFVTNGSRTAKEGIEFQLSMKRIQVLRTKITVNGAWFRTRYTNSQPQFYRPSVAINGKAYPYVGYYDDSDNYLRERFNTNLTFDTQIPRFGLIFSTSLQWLWFSGSRNGYCNPYPSSYIDKNLAVHPFNAEDEHNGVLAQMIKTGRDETLYRYNTIPMSMNVNLKVTKSLFNEKLFMAVFVNKIADYTPSYTSAFGMIVRREVKPYFGMEINTKI